MTFEFIPGAGGTSGGLYWKLKTITETTECDCPPAPVAKTGQNYAYVTGGDGDLQMGPWPVPRFTDNKDGTVTDNLTGLVWLKHPGCFAEALWADAAASISTLKSGECGLSDGSVPGDWRMPNIKEAESLLHYEYVYPAVPNTSGTGQAADGDTFTYIDNEDAYWTSTIFGDREHASPWGGQSAWYVILGLGYKWWDGKLS